LTSSFAINVTAASGAGDCQGLGSAVTNVTINTQPNVTVSPPSSELGGVCIANGTLPTKNLTFNVGSSTGAPAAISVSVEPQAAANCTANTEAVSKLPTH
jgi:hypothetical protein